MNLPLPRLNPLARELLALEAARGKSGKGKGKSKGVVSQAEQAVAVCEGLREVLTAFAGSAGYRSLLSRAVKLAQMHSDSLATVQVLDNGSLAWPENGDGESDAGEGGEILVSQLLDLLVMFIGEALTHQLVRSAWPEVPPLSVGNRTKDSK